MGGPFADRAGSSSSSSSSSSDPATEGVDRPDEMRSRLEAPRMLVIAVVDNVAEHDARGASDQSEDGGGKDDGDSEPKPKAAKNGARQPASVGTAASLREAVQTVHTLVAAASRRSFGAAPIEMTSYAALVEHIVVALVRQPTWSLSCLNRCRRCRRDPDAPLHEMYTAVLRLRLREIGERDSGESAHWKAAWCARVDRALLPELSGSTLREWMATVLVELLAVFLVAVSFVALFVHADEPSPSTHIRVTDFFHEHSPFVALTRDAVANSNSLAECAFQLVGWTTLALMTPQFLGVATAVLAATERPIALSAFIVLRLAVFAGGMRLSWFFVVLALAWHQLEAPAAAWYLRHSRVTHRHSPAELRAAIARHLRALGRSEEAWAAHELARICRVSVAAKRDREAGASDGLTYAPGISVCVNNLDDARRLVEHYTGPSYALQRARSGVRFLVVARDLSAVRHDEEENCRQWYAAAAQSTARLADCFCDEPHFVMPDAVLQYDADAVEFSRFVSDALRRVFV